MWRANFPFCYTYVVRLRNPVSAINVVICEWLPVAVVLRLLYSASLWITLLMFAGNFMVYECGYLVNDLADSTTDPHGRRLEARQINALVFYSSRLLLFVSVLFVLWTARGARFALTYLIFATLLLLGFLWHTSRQPRKLHFLRIFTFAFLQLYKSAPIVFPQVPLTSAAWILTAIFLCWGLSRTISYTLIKYGGERTSRGQDFDPLRLLHPMSLIICCPLLLATQSHPLQSAPAALWLIYAGIAVLRSSFQLSKWRLAWG